MAEERVPHGVDVTKPSVARIYDYYLGGKDNFVVDRETAARALEQVPDLPQMAREGRRFLGRVVRFLAESGIRQFVDIGSGLPTQRNVHEIAQAARPDARVVYVDNDPIVLAHARALLSGDGQTTVVEGDMTDPDAILADPRLRRMIDPEQPVAYLLLSVLHLIPDDEVMARIPARMKELMSPGSHLAMSLAVSDVSPRQASQIASVYRGSGAIAEGPRSELRTRAEVEPLFDGLELVEPGLVYVTDWRPDLPANAGPPEPTWSVGGVGRKVR